MVCVTFINYLSIIFMLLSHYQRTNQCGMRSVECGIKT